MRGGDFGRWRNWLHASLTFDSPFLAWRAEAAPPLFNYTQSLYPPHTYAQHSLHSNPPCPARPAPRAAQKHLKHPEIAAKVDKLVSAGIIQIR